MNYLQLRKSQRITQLKSTVKHAYNKGMLLHQIKIELLKPGVTFWKLSNREVTYIMEGIK